MNNNRIYKWLGGSLAAAAISACFTACSDDHFDIVDITPDGAGKVSLWDNISSKPELSQYKDILQSVYYSQSEDKTTPQTYADVLSGNATYTIWAPTNGSFNYEYYKGLLNTGERDSIYKVEKELIRNSMTRYSMIINSTDSVKVQLFNDKSAWLNYDKKTIKGMLMTHPNIASTNGVLHITEGPLPYQPNLYEFLKSRPDLDSISSFIKSFEKKQFDEFASTQGPTVNGEITWVDSVTYITNDYTRYYMGAFLEREDSNYVMIIPNNDAWKNTLDKTKNYFKYKLSYKQDVNTQTEQGKDTTITGAETKFTQIEIDSMTNFAAKDAICRYLSFNANWQYEQIPITSIADIRNADARIDSLRPTAGRKFKKTGTLSWVDSRNEVLAVDNYADLFGNADPIEVSNGYAYIVDNFAFPSSYYAPDKDLVARGYFESADKNCNPSALAWSKKVSLDKVDEETGEVIAHRDSTYKYDYLVMSNTSATAHPGAYFKLDNVLSCKYDIYVVIGYNTNYDLQNKFRAYISYDTDAKRVKDEALKNPNEDAVDAEGKSIYNTNDFVNRKPVANDDLTMNYTDTILIARDFEFPVAYWGLDKAYPTIQLKSNFTSKKKAYYSREIWVNAIIMKAKEW